jgi:hypothetical protein
MAEQVLFAQERYGLRYEIVECCGSRIVRITILSPAEGPPGVILGEILSFTPQQCDVLGNFGSLARARANMLSKLQGKSDAAKESPSA